MKNQSLYEASVKALTEAGVPGELAHKVSVIVANDEPGVPNFGRTPEDQALVDEAMVHYWKNQK